MLDAMRALYPGQVTATYNMDLKRSFGSAVAVEMDPMLIGASSAQAVTTADADAVRLKRREDSWTSIRATITLYTPLIDHSTHSTTSNRYHIFHSLSACGISILSRKPGALPTFRILHLHVCGFGTPW
jgi:hypothetical protein